MFEAAVRSRESQASLPYCTLRKLLVSLIKNSQPDSDANTFPGAIAAIISFNVLSSSPL